MSRRYPKPDLTKRDDRGGVYYFRYYHPIIKPDGKKGYERRNLSTDLKDKPKAEKFAEQYIKDAVDGKPLQASVAVIEAKPTVLLTDRIGKFIRSTYTGQKAANTILSVAGNLARMVKFLGTNDRSAVTEELALDAYNTFKATNNKLGKLPNAKGQDHWIKDCCRYWDWEVALRQVQHNPFRGPHILRPKSDAFYVAEETWTAKEAEDIYNALELQEDKDAFCHMRWTGMYPRDTFHLRRSMVVAADGLGIRMRRNKSTSSKQVINLPIRLACPEIEGLLMEKWETAGSGRLYARHYADDKDWQWGHVLNKRVAKAWLATYPNSTPKMLKSLRHTRTTEWIEAGIEPDVIGGWLGHVPGSQMVLKIYAHRKALMEFKKASPLLLANPSQGHT